MLRGCLILLALFASLAFGQDCRPYWQSIAMKKMYRGENQFLYRGRFFPVTYLDQISRQPYVVKIENGLFVGADGRPLQTPARRWYQLIKPSHMIVLAGDGTLYAGVQRLGRFHHSSFLAGEPVAFAGEGRFEHGRLVYLNNQSGHYLTPSWMLSRFVDWIEARGVGTETIHFEQTVGW